MKSQELDLFKNGIVALLLVLALVVCATLVLLLFLWSDAIHIGTGSSTAFIGIQQLGRS